MSDQSLPVVIIGAGPVGLAAAAHALPRHLTPLVLEAGPRMAPAFAGGATSACSPRGGSGLILSATERLSRNGWMLPACR